MGRRTPNTQSPHTSGNGRKSVLTNGCALLRLFPGDSMNNSPRPPDTFNLSVAAHPAVLASPLAMILSTRESRQNSWIGKLTNGQRASGFLSAPIDSHISRDDCVALSEAYSTTDRPVLSSRPESSISISRTGPCIERVPNFSGLARRGLVVH